MIKSHSAFLVRTISENDRQELANLVHFERHIHRHLDWRTPIDWIGIPPFFIIEQEGKIVAALACPPDPPGIAWVRLFAVSTGLSVGEAWRELWQQVSQQLVEIDKNMRVAAIPLNTWFRSTLEANDFELADHVVVLLRESRQPLDFDGAPGYPIRPMRSEDLEQVEGVDHAAFADMWQFSRAGLQAGLKDSALASVAEDHGEIIGYQISTATSIGGHLARLAVLPEYQKHGVGLALLHEILAGFKQRGARSVTVNTQESNHPSLALYKKVGFHRTGEAYPVYQYRLGPR
jgi:ribosomal-protein-alanine N-acetyltransferase